MSADWPLSHTEPPVRVMSVQSHVCRDYVGNRAAVPLLMAAGFHVDQVNSCLYSSLFVHQGDKFVKENADGIMGGLRIAMDHPLGGGFPGAPIPEEMKPTSGGDLSAVITGYIPKAEFLEGVIQQIAEMRAADPSFFYLMDPVLGDMGHLYVGQEMIEKYQKSIQHADLITPNHYELMCLAYGTHDEAEHKIDSVEKALAAIQVVRERGNAPRWIICSSIPTGEGELTAIVTDGNSMGGKENDGDHRAFKIAKREIYIAGTGDALATCLLAFIMKHKRACGSVDNPAWKADLPMEDYMQVAIDIVQKMIDATLETVDKNGIAGTWRTINPIGASSKILLDYLNKEKLS